MRKLTGRWYVKNYFFFHIIEVEHVINDEYDGEKAVWSKASKVDLIALNLIKTN